MHVNLLVIGGCGLGKTEFIAKLLQGYDNEILPARYWQQQEVGCQIAKGEQSEKKHKSPPWLCTHTREFITSTCGDLVIHYHVQDAPGETPPEIIS